MTPEYVVKSPLKFDGKIYKPGETVSMEAKNAAELIAGDVLNPAALADDKEPASEAKPKKGKEK